MLPSALIYQAAHIVKVFKLKYCIQSCSVRISTILFPPYLTTLRIPGKTYRRVKRVPSFLWGPGSNLCPSYSDWGFVIFLIYSKQLPRQYIELNCKDHPSEPLQFIIHHSSYPTLCVSYRQCRYRSTNNNKYIRNAGQFKKEDWDYSILDSDTLQSLFPTIKPWRWEQIIL